jgi:hypothetical protein
MASQSNDLWKRDFLRSRTALVCAVVATLVAAYLLSEHTAHVFGFAPYALILVCPLMHLFMHRAHKLGESDEEYTAETPPGSHKTSSTIDSVMGGHDDY